VRARQLRPGYPARSRLSNWEDTASSNRGNCPGSRLGTENRRYGKVPARAPWAGLAADPSRGRHWCFGAQLTQNADVLGGTLRVVTTNRVEFAPALGLDFIDTPIAGNGFVDVTELPATSFTVVALPMKIGGGSGGPLRIVAILAPGR
jgi:hypothetical protein